MIKLKKNQFSIVTIRCTAQNPYYHTRPIRTFSTSLEVVNAIESQSKYGVILPLFAPENRSVEIRTGDILKLFCFACSEDVRWTFRHRNGNQSFIINNTSNVLVFSNVSYATHDGFYNCSTTTDFQVNLRHFQGPFPRSLILNLNSKFFGFVCRFTMSLLAYLPP